MMTEDEVLASAFAMPPTSSTYPEPPFPFVDREFITITYRTDPAALERVVPAPLEVATTGRQIRVRQDAEFDGIWLLYGIRRDHPGYDH